MIPGALEDFDKNTPSTTKQCVENESKPSVSSSVEARQDKGVQGYTDEVVQDDSAVEMEAQFAKAAEDFENAMKTMLGNEPEILAQLGQFSKAAANADPGR